MTRPAGWAEVFERLVLAIVAYTARVAENTGYQPMLAMLHYTVASSFQVHGDSSRDGSERSFDTPKNNVSIS